MRTLRNSWSARTGHWRAPAAISRDAAGGKEVAEFAGFLRDLRPKGLAAPCGSARLAPAWRDGMKQRKLGSLLSLALLLSSCGGGGGDGGGSLPGQIGGGRGGGKTPGSLRARQDWAAQQLREWYLFPETLPASL